MALKSKLNHLIVLLPALAILFSLFSSLPVSAQTTKDPWSPPVNLSKSGSTSDPVAVQDANGVLHVIWRDKYADFEYARWNGSEWSQPLSEQYPFGDNSPRLVADSKGFIHAFWIEADGSLAYTRLSPTPTGLTFTKVQSIAEAALSFDVTIDTRDDLHVVYVRPKDAPGLPAGIYYRQSPDAGNSWTPGDVIYPSLYLRAVDKKDANVSIASTEVSGQTHLYVGWDNKPRKRVYFSMSLNNGSSWSDPKEVQAAEPSLGYAGPYGIHVSATGSDVLLIWLTGDPASDCRQSYQWSKDGGESWEKPRTMLAEFFGCPQSSHLISNEKGLIFLLTSLQDQLYLVAWDGSQWSTPEFQRTLTGFLDPDTHDMVLYGCQAPVLTKDGGMFVVGCDQGNGGDIWATSRQVSDANTWFPPPPVWSAPLVIGNSKQDVSSLVSAADSLGKFHVLWAQMQDQSVVPSGELPRRVIYYTQSDGNGWTQPVNIIISPAGDADQLALTIDSKDRLLLAWRERQTGEVFFSWASASQANSPAEWSKPLPLPVIETMATSPYIQVDSGGTIYVAYAIPINENRGIYVAASTDGGNTWSQSTKAVDAVASQWEMVDEPQLAITSDGQLHLVWKIYNVVGINRPLGVYYANSEDSGLNWSPPESLVDAPVYWSNLMAAGNKNVDLVWQEQTLKGFIMKHRVSQDDGQNWERAAIIASFGAEPVPANLAATNSGLVELVVVDQDEAKNLLLKQWSWDGQRWSEEDGIPVSTDPTVGIPYLSSSLSQAGDLGVSYLLAQVSSSSTGSSYQIDYTGRKVNLAQPSVTPAAVTPAPRATPAATVTSTQTITPTLSSAAQVTTIPPTGQTVAPPAPGPSRRLIVMVVGIVLLAAAVVGGFFTREVMRRKPSE